MRKKFVFFAFVPVVLLMLTLYFFLDGWVESGFESAGESVVGAKVEIDGLDLTLMPLGITFQRLQVADPNDPWMNIFETSRTSFLIDFNQLLRGKFIIETVEVNDLIVGTKRSTSGAIPKKQEPPETGETGPSLTDELYAYTKEKLADAPIFDLEQLKKQLNIDSLLNPDNLQSLKYYDSLKTLVALNTLQWERIQNDFEAQKKEWDRLENEAEQSRQMLAQTEQRWRAVNWNELKTPQAIQEFVTANVTTPVASVRSTVTGLQQQASLTYAAVNGRYDSVTTSLNILSKAVKTADDILKGDYERIRALAKLPDLNMGSLAQTLLGNSILGPAQRYLHWIDLARTTIPRYMPKTPKEPKPARLEGQNIRFPIDRSYPKFWLKQILLSGGTDAKQDPNFLFGKGQVTDISTDQKITGEPIVADIGLKSGTGRIYTLGASFDRRKEVPLDTYDATVRGIPVRDMRIGSESFLPSSVSQANADFKVSVIVPGNAFRADFMMDVQSISLSFDRDPRGEIERLVKNVLLSVNGFNVKVKMWKENGPLDVALTTSLDDQLVAATKKVLGAELEKMKADIKAKVDGYVASKKAEAMGIYEQHRTELTRKADGYKKLANEKVALLETKKRQIEEQAKKFEDEANKKIEELKGKLEGEAKRQFDEAKRKAEEEAKKQADEAKRKAEEELKRKLGLPFKK